jgi:hypothetical protein
MTASHDTEAPLVSQSQIERWEREYASLGKRRATIKVMIDAARALVPLSEKPSQPVAPPTRRRRVAKKTRRKARPKITPPASAIEETFELTPPPSPKRRRPETSEWKPLVRLIIETAPHQPVSYPEAKAEILKSELAERFRQSDKGFYNAISRMHKAGEIVAYKGHLFMPGAYAQFEENLRAGRVADLRVENAAHHSPMGEAMLDILRGRKAGAESGHLIWELKKNPIFATQIEKNKSHPYNVIARLAKTNQVIKRGKRYFILVNEAPPEMGSASNVSDSRETA